MAKKKVNKVLGIPKQLREELEEVRLKFKNKAIWDDRTTNEYIKECNMIIDELTSYKRELRGNDKKKYALNFEFPIRKNENG